MKKLTGKHAGLTGFVPTMGFLQEGHLSLVRLAKKQCDVVVVSIYVNPTQFSPSEDLASYPRDFERDYALLAELEVDYIFFPDNNEMYPPDYNTWVEVKGISEVLCGRSRPSHFRGVTTIVLKLVNIVQPDYMYMGEKDFQQITVLKKMLKDLNSDTIIVPCPIVREPDGLALSSRNKYLDEKQRQDALCLSKAVKLARQSVAQGCRNPEVILNIITQFITAAHGKIDYIEFRQSNDLSATEIIDKETRIFLAIYIGKTRLIDNAILLQ
ncbi:MAG: pantoate--beta-alanine ligase [Candidatus Cloacimonetes bacterium]|nr:pantoate--beta-alanine ligase [Candidatus Cloacimonadota bacterium]